MGIVDQWNGEGLVSGNLTTSTVGTGDSAFDSVPLTAGATITYSTETPALTHPRADTQATILATPNATNRNAAAAWTLPGGAYGFRAYFRFLAGAAVGAPHSFISCRDGATSRWYLRRELNSGTNRVSLIDSASTILAGPSTASETLDTGTAYRIEGIVSGTAITVRYFLGDSPTHFLEQSGTLTSAAKTDIFFGVRAATANLHPQMRFGNLAVGDTADWIGPYSAPSAGPSWSIMQGGIEVPLTYEGRYVDGVLDATEPTGIEVV